MDDLISRQAAIDKLKSIITDMEYTSITDEEKERMARKFFADIPSSAQPTIFGYNVEHLELIARVLQKENLPPEKVTDALTDIGRILAIVKDEFEEALRKVVEK